MSLKGLLKNANKDAEKGAKEDAKRAKEQEKEAAKKAKEDARLAKEEAKKQKEQEAKAEKEKAKEEKAAKAEGRKIVSARHGGHVRKHSTGAATNSIESGNHFFKTFFFFLYIQFYQILKSLQLKLIYKQNTIRKQQEKLD